MHGEDPLYSYILFSPAPTQGLLHICQELDGSGLLDVSETVILGSNGSVVQGTRNQRRAQSSNWTRDERNVMIVKEQTNTRLG